MECKIAEYYYPVSNTYKTVTTLENKTIFWKYLLT